MVGKGPRIPFIPAAPVGLTQIVPEIHPVELPLPFVVVRDGRVSGGGVEKPVYCPAGEIIPYVNHIDIPGYRRVCERFIVTYGPVYVLRVKGPRYGRASTKVGAECSQCRRGIPGKRGGTDRT